MKHEITFVGSQGAGRQKIVWITDLHLDAADEERVQRFFDVVAKQELDFILVGGDISNGVNSLLHLNHLVEGIEKPFYFVLGNHDFYYGSIKEIREIARRTAEKFKNVHYLTTSKVFPLSSDTALVGHDGWSDARAGDFLHSHIMLHDYILIKELKDLTHKERMEVLHRLGSEATEHIRRNLTLALQTFDRVVVLTHTPPFRESCLYEGRMSNEHWAPHFVCQEMGAMLLEEMKVHPQKQVLVLCGHSHHDADYSPLPNLRVLTGHSTLGNPSVAGVVAIS